MDLNSVYTEVIMEHSQHSHNKRHLENPDWCERGHNPSCGDDITLEVKIDGDKIKEAAFIGSGCAISQASTSIMIDLIEGKSLEEANAIAEKFLAMIKNTITDEEELEVLEDALALKNIAHMPARVKCAVLSWRTLKEALDKKKTSKKYIDK